MVGLNSLFLRAMKRLFSLITFCFLFYFNSNSQITLSHNVGNIPIKTDWVNCDEEQSWARVFNLEDFGISTNEQLVIRFAEVAISNAKKGSGVILTISSVDENFPDSDIRNLSYNHYLETPEIGDTPEIMKFEFKTPIVIQSNIKRILVTISQSNILSTSVTPFQIAGTVDDNDTSWFTGCREYYTFIETKNLANPKPNANFFINVTGEKRSIINSPDNLYLSHNTNDNVVKTNMPSCSGGIMYWARKFDLVDFGISDNEEFIINRGDVGITGAGWLANVKFNIYKIDENFPSSFSESNLIGSSQKTIISTFSWGYQSARIMTTDFDKPIVIPADVKSILVEVERGIEYGDGHLFISGTENDNKESWFRGNCPFNTGNQYENMSNLSRYGTGINFYITINGEAKTIFPFEIINDNNCINFSNDFSLTNQAEIDTVTWNFDDPSTGTNNTSTQNNVTHQFSNPGIYNVTADVLHTDGTSYIIPKEIEIFDAPNINPTVELKQCDNSDINGFSFFNLNEVKEEIITNSDDYTITFYEEKIDAENNGVSITDLTTYKNEIVSVDKVWARVENSNGCYRISEVNLFVSTTQIPSTLLNSFYQCDEGIDTTDGIATFNFSSVTSDIITFFPAGQQLIINYYRNEDDALSEENEIKDITNYENIGYPNQQNIYIRVDSKFDNDCLGLGAHISLNVEKVPVANPVIINPECDNDRDGLFSFDTSTINSTIIGTQTNVAVSYFDKDGIGLSSPLPNPFITTSQIITAKITNTSSKDLDGQCSDETTINFVVNSVPIANIIAPQEECDDDTDGIVGFDTSIVESTVLGNQTGLIVRYFDENNAELQSPLPNPFFTTSQTITVRLENPVYDVCFEDTTIDFIVRDKPTFDLITEEIICMISNPELEITVENPSGNHTYIWKDENKITVGDKANVTVTKGGVYKVVATSIYGCNSEEQEILIRESSSSTININDIKIEDDSESNTIQINTTDLGLGEYEFRLLDADNIIVRDYQNDPYFNDLVGGVYTVEVNDRNNCGTIPFEVSLLEFPKYFTPNGDGTHDYWQIKGISKNFYKSGRISIFDRYGNSIYSFTIDDIGWDGISKGKTLSSNDYWFYAELTDKKDITRVRSGNFSLVRK